METIRVKSRKLEQFFYLHGIGFISCEKDPEDGMTVWTYEKTDEAVRVMEEFKDVMRRRLARKGA